MKYWNGHGRPQQINIPQNKRHLMGTPGSWIKYNTYQHTKGGTNPNRHQPTGVVETAQVYRFASSYSTSLASMIMYTYMSSHVYYTCYFIL